ncbi:MAG TPA: PaaI family thioesterase [Anaerolineales bacterium]
MSAIQTEERILASYSRQNAMALIGAALVKAGGGEAVIELPFRADLTQQHGFIHAGIVTMIVDTACGYAAYSLMPPSAAVLTVEYKVNFVSPASGDMLVARGRVLKPGRTLMACYGEVHARTGGEEKLVASMLATMITRLDTGLQG